MLEEAALATGRDGLAAINPNFNEGRIDVYWKGEIPGALREAVKQVREGFGVRVHDAPHSWLEMDEEAHRILALVNGNEELEFIATVAMKHDLSGLRLLVSDPEYQSSRTDGGIQAELQSDMPITVEYAEWVAGLTPAGS
ncbi:hypothetical protein PJ985_06875 [Streptomyces sp. ACA25]|uniref:hypothetical protein n=1 Tax=Streptomyces sp. ACA25 TaxID=3022596 RepID=UPI002306FFEA|nr:hypothetical protein [Streptomyces sp. ACA25]MDB1087290.1 hypothetical protein [Streptomyces sp. ACA25]